MVKTIGVTGSDELEVIAFIKENDVEPSNVYDIIDEKFHELDLARQSLRFLSMPRTREVWEELETNRHKKQLAEERAQERHEELVEKIRNI